MITNLASRLLHRNVSVPQLIGFTLSNFIGLAIIVIGVQMYCDMAPIWSGDDSFIKRDYLVVNRKVTSASTLGNESTGFTPKEIEELSAQPWVRSVGEFTSAGYRVTASVGSGDRAMHTSMFFEAIPDEFIDARDASWYFSPANAEVPIILSKDYLTLYNFGFASSAGLPQLSESMMGSIPLRLTLSNDTGSKVIELTGRVAGFSDRLNTILVPSAFMQWSNSMLGDGRQRDPSRLIIDVSSPGDVAISPYLESHGIEAAGDNSRSSASFLLKVAAGIVIGIGGVITVLSFFILLLSISLLMQKNREKLHLLLQLGYELNAVGAPYRRLVAVCSLLSLALALAVTYATRMAYLSKIEPLGGGGGGVWQALAVGAGVTLLTILFNLTAIRRRVASAWRN